MKILIVLLSAGLCLAQDPNPRFAGTKTATKERTATTLAPVVAPPQAEAPSPVAALQQELVLVLTAQTQFLQRQIAMMAKAQQYGCTLDQSMNWQCSTPKPEPKK